MGKDEEDLEASGFLLVTGAGCLHYYYCKAINNSIGPGMQLMCMPRMCEALGAIPTTTENRESVGLCVLIGRE